MARIGCHHWKHHYKEKELVWEGKVQTFIVDLKFRSSKGLGVLCVPAKAGASPSCQWCFRGGWWKPLRSLWPAACAWRFCPPPQPLALSCLQSTVTGLAESAQSLFSTSNRYPHFTEQETDIQRGCGLSKPFSDLSTFEGKSSDSSVPLQSRVWWLKTVSPKLALHWLWSESLLLCSSEKAANKWSLLFVCFFCFVLRCLWLNSLISLAVKAVLSKMSLNCCGFWVLDWMSETFAITGNSVTLDLLSVPLSWIPQQCDLAPWLPINRFWHLFECITPLVSINYFTIV